MKIQKTISDLLGGQKVVPVAVIEDEAQALGLPKALLEGGVKVIEITLRSDYALKSIASIKQNYPEMMILAGTVNTPEQMQLAVAAGAEGIVSPGFTHALATRAIELDVAYLPGVASASDILLASEYGLSEFKLFPANIVGGVGALKAFSGPFLDYKFCPTGGVSKDNFQEYLALDNVMCVGGSWLAPKQAARAGDWLSITRLCEEALST